MKTQITKRQKELLSVIYQYIRDTGYPPTLGEMKEKLGVSSNQSILDLLANLEKRHLVKKNEGAARGITISPLGYEILGKPALVATVGITAAGPFTEAIEISGQWQAIPSIQDKIERLDSDIYILKIFGDSMINAGIQDGDLVLVQKKKEFYSNEIVVAQTPDGTTVKRFISEDKPPYVYLKPENPKYKNIRFTEEMSMDGKIISIFKNGFWQTVK